MDFGNNGPTPKEGQAAKKVWWFKKGLVGSMLNVRGVKDVRALQKLPWKKQD
jgi:beta-glucosidase